MALRFRNSTPNPVFVVLGYQNPACNNNFGIRGWYEVPPGRTVSVFGGRVGGRSFYWYAEDDFGHVWAGPIPQNVPNEAFDMCSIAACPPPRCRTVGFRTIRFTGTFDPITTIDHTINLVLTSSQRKAKSAHIRDVLPTKRKLKYRKYRRGIINKIKRRTVSQCTKCNACAKKRKL
ncbi:DUF1036 domain-containing protein [Ammoniphilus sp. YIM 78166]|uniref:DUF1036 domain-containing protein n=1 Tax=Ammoniphilus sp. YIM 78166 TaxID=1644106 RepID=UPI0010701D54